MRFKYILLPTTLLGTPLLTQAQEDVFSLGEGILLLFNNFLIPLLVTLAVLFFVVNAVRYFIVESDDTASRAVARELGMYGILALVFIVAFWGIVNFFVVSFGFVEDDCYPIPDWIGDERCGEGPEVTSDLDVGGGFADGGSGFDTGDFDAGIGGSGDAPIDTTPPDELPPPGGGGDDLPIVEEPPLSEGPLVSAQAAVSTDAEDFYTELADGESDLGPGGPLLVDSGVFADLDDFSGGNNDLERLQAAYRLNQMGELGDDEYANLVSRTNNYRAETGLTPITPSIIEDIAIPEDDWPNGLVAERDALITDRIAEYNTIPTADNITAQEASNIEFLLTSPALPLDQRYENFNALYDDPALTALITDDFAEDYLGYLNTEAVLRDENLSDLYQ